MKESKKRSVIKAISWRITGSIDTFLLAFFITGKLSYASAISSTELITKVLLYYIHERVWFKVSWGKENYPVYEKQQGNK